MPQQPPAERPDNGDLKFPNTLRGLRRVRFRSARDFAKAAGIEEETVGRYERGERYPSEGMVAYMAQHLGLVEGGPDYTTLFADAEHDRQKWKGGGHGKETAGGETG